MYLRCFERTNCLIGGLGRASVFHLLFRLVSSGSLGIKVRVVRKRDWFVGLEVVSRLAEWWMGLVGVFGPRCFWSLVFCIFICKVIGFLRF
jgi:hypothetical protein